MISDVVRGSVIAALVLTLVIAVPLYVRLQFMGDAAKARDVQGSPHRSDTIADNARPVTTAFRVPPLATTGEPSPANLRGSLK